MPPLSPSLSPLNRYVLRGLRKCYMPARESWSYIYHLDGRADANESLPAWDAFYSLNVILGLAALGGHAWRDDYDLPALLQTNSARLLTLPAPAYAKGMALWASAQLGVPLEGRVAEKLREFIRDRARRQAFRAQDAGMILSGIANQKWQGNGEYDDAAHELFQFIKSSFLADSGIFFDQPAGLRRNFSSFATQTYLTTACYHYGLHYANEEALGIADAACRKMIAYQGPYGEWPWFYFVPRGQVVDNYEVYTVHQDGMAALFLSIGARRGIPGARDAIIKGFEWVFGNNQLRRNMMVPELGMFYRSILRRGELTDKSRRMFRGVANGLIGRADSYAPAASLDVRRECRSYHLGWVLYSFGSRADLPQLTCHPAFIQAECADIVTASGVAEIPGGR